MPEEWLRLVTEVTMTLLTGLVPHSFSTETMKASYYNRVGHTRLQGEHPIYDNFHVNHHSHFQKNFGQLYPPVDLLMGTEHGDVSTLETPKHDRYICTREETAESYVLDIRLQTNSAG